MGNLFYIIMCLVRPSKAFLAGLVLWLSGPFRMEMGWGFESDNRKLTRDESVAGVVVRSSEDVPDATVCGLYSAYAVCRALQVDVPLGLLLRIEFISHENGSSM